LIWIFRTHELSRLIMFNRDSQFISIVWKSLCLRLSIKMKLFINYHSQIDDQTERANQNVEWYLRSYCSYMQEDWLCQVKYLSSSQVLNLSRLDSSQNSWLEYSSWVEMFNSSIWVESENWNRVLIWNFQLDSSKHEDK